MKRTRRSCREEVGPVMRAMASNINVRQWQRNRRRNSFSKRRHINIGDGNKAWKIWRVSEVVLPVVVQTMNCSTGSGIYLHCAGTWQYWHLRISCKIRYKWSNDQDVRITRCRRVLRVKSHKTRDRNAVWKKPKMTKSWSIVPRTTRHMHKLPP